MAPWEADHTLTLDRNIFTDDGRSLVIPSNGGYTILVNALSDFSSGDDRVETLLDLLEADEDLINGTARKLHRITKAVLLSKTVTGTGLQDISISE
jgi:hypothetical protein